MYLNNSSSYPSHVMVLWYRCTYINALKYHSGDYKYVRLRCTKVLINELFPKQDDGGYIAYYSVHRFIGWTFCIDDTDASISNEYCWRFVEESWRK